MGGYFEGSSEGDFIIGFMWSGVYSNEQESAVHVFTTKGDRNGLRRDMIAKDYWRSSHTYTTLGISTYQVPATFVIKPSTVVVGGDGSATDPFKLVE